MMCVRFHIKTSQWDALTTVYVKLFIYASSRQRFVELSLFTPPMCLYHHAEAALMWV